MNYSNRHVLRGMLFLFRKQYKFILRNFTKYSTERNVTKEDAFMKAKKSIGNSFMHVDINERIDKMRSPKQKYSRCKCK